MNIDSIQDSTRVVVSELRHGSILPGARSEMWRDIFLLPGADVRGAVWGNRLLVEGPGVSIRDAVYVRSEIAVKRSEKPPASGDVTFGSCVTAPDSVVIEDTGARTRFLGSIYSGTVNLNNAIVYGNVYAKNAVIRNSVVLGGVFCKNSLKIENCVLSTFRSRSVEVREGVILLFPTAMSQTPVTFVQPIRAMPFFDISGTAEAEGGSVLLDARDTYHVDVPVQEGRTERLYVISLDERILEANSLIGVFRKNQAYLEGMSLGAHLAPEHREAFVERREEMEQQMFSLLSNAQVREVSGRSSIDALFMRDDIVDSVRSFSSDDVIREVLGLRRTHAAAPSE